MALADGVRVALTARGLTQRELVQRVPKDAGRWAVYRVLSGRSLDPRVSTLVILCEALQVSPTELLQLSGLQLREERGDTAHDLRLRKAFRSIQHLEAGSRDLATKVLDAVTGVLDRPSGGDGRQGRTGGL